MTLAGAGAASVPPVLGVERSVSGKRWVWRAADGRTGLAIAQKLGVAELVGRLLAERMSEDEGYETAMQSNLSRKPVSLIRESESYPDRDDIHDRKRLR